LFSHSTFRHSSGRCLEFRAVFSLYHSTEVVPLELLFIAFAFHCFVADTIYARIPPIVYSVLRVCMTGSDSDLGPGARSFHWVLPTLCSRCRCGWSLRVAGTVATSQRCRFFKPLYRTACGGACHDGCGSLRLITLTVAWFGGCAASSPVVPNLDAALPLNLSHCRLNIRPDSDAATDILPVAAWQRHHGCVSGYAISAALPGRVLPLDCSAPA